MHPAIESSVAAHPQRAATLSPMRSVALFICSFASAFAGQSDDTQIVRFGYADACPHMCPKGENQGFTVDIVRAIFEASGIQVQFVDLPWARAAKMALNGELDGVLSAGRAETPEMLFPQQELAFQQDCFYGNANDYWHPTDALSFAGRTSIVFSGWVNEAEYLQSLGADGYHRAFVEFSIDTEYIARVTNMVRRHRADAFWMDPTVYAYSKNLYPQLLDNSLKLLGCVKEQKLYLALTPAKPELSKQLADIFDQRMPLLRQSGQLAEILNRYGLTDWQRGNPPAEH